MFLLSETEVGLGNENGIAEGTPFSFFNSNAAKKIVVSGVMTVPTGAALSVKACNNAFDASPTWEDITTAFLNRQAYSFTNTTKTATKWGINIQFEILKGTATQQIIVDGFGFSFE